MGLAILMDDRHCRGERHATPTPPTRAVKELVQVRMPDLFDQASEEILLQRLAGRGGSSKLEVNLGRDALDLDARHELRIGLRRVTAGEKGRGQGHR
jgi:hypothetical protein